MYVECVFTVLWCSYEDGSTQKVKRRERPQVLVLNNKPTLLFSGVQGEATNSFTLVQEINTK